MEKFTVYVKSVFNNDKARKISVTSEDTWLAHKAAILQTHQLKEDIVSIKDSMNNEVYNINTGFLFDND